MLNIFVKKREHVMPTKIIERNKKKKKQEKKKRNKEKKSMEIDGYVN